MRRCLRRCFFHSLCSKPQRQICARWQTSVRRCLCCNSPDKRPAALPKRLNWEEEETVIIVLAGARAAAAPAAAVILVLIASLALSHVHKQARSQHTRSFPSSLHPSFFFVKCRARKRRRRNKNVSQGPDCRPPPPTYYIYRNTYIFIRKQTNKQIESHTQPRPLFTHTRIHANVQGSELCFRAITPLRPNLRWLEYNTPPHFRQVTSSCCCCMKAQTPCFPPIPPFVFPLALSVIFPFPPSPDGRLNERVHGQKERKKKTDISLNQTVCAVAMMDDGCCASRVLVREHARIHSWTVTGHSSAQNGCLAATRATSSGESSRQARRGDKPLVRHSLIHLLITARPPIHRSISAVQFSIRRPVIAASSAIALELFSRVLSSS